MNTMVASGSRVAITRASSIDTAVPDAIQRAIVRTKEQRFHPLVCIDDAGRYVGIVRMDIGMSAFDRLAEGDSKTLSVIAGKGSKQIVKRFHRRSRRSVSVEIAAANLLWRTRTKLERHRLWTMLIQ